MKLRIAPTRLISEVQDDFNKSFPYLKLEFYQNKNGQKRSTPEIRMPHNKRLGDCQARIADGELEIVKEMKAKDLEKALKEMFGLTAQVFRHSGSLWLQTTVTDDWSLEKQNDHGRELSKPPEPRVIPDREDEDS
jgi:hypothetical protein